MIRTNPSITLIDSYWKIVEYHRQLYFFSSSWLPNHPR